MIILILLFISFAISAPSNSYLSKVVNYEGLNFDDVVANEYISVLNDCNSLDSHISSLPSSLTVLKKYIINGFCGYSFKLQSDQLTFQDNSGSLSQIIQDQFSRPDLSNYLEADIVKFVAPNHKARLSAIQPNPPWNLARLSRRKDFTIDQTSAYEYDNTAGFGVDAYVIDNRILVNHTDFQGRVTIGAEFLDFPYDNPGIPDSYKGHATHVAGIIGSKTYGVAKEVTLIGVTCLYSDGGGSISNILAGLNWAFNNTILRKRPAVINLSLSSPISDAGTAAISAIVKFGIPVVAAAGNDQIDACSVFPGNVQENGVFVVASMNSNNEFSSQFSNYGSCVNILAPGEGIISTWINPEGYPELNRYAAYWSGTSQAAPHVTGVIALYLADFTITPQELQDVIINDSTKNQILSLDPKTPNRLIYTDAQLSIESLSQ